MVTLNVATRDGTWHSVEGCSGWSLMEVLRTNGFDEVLAICGGCCSCGTCHVYVDTHQLSLLPPLSEEEDDLLECSSHRTAQSRLSCQLTVGIAINGLRVQIAPED